VASKVEIIIDAVDKASGELKDIRDAFKGLQAEISKTAAASEAPKKSAMSWTDFRSAYLFALDAVKVGQQIWAATAQEYLNYGEQVEKVSRLTGLQAEEASRLIQVADDLRVSQASLNAALTIGAKKYDVSIDGLAQMADQYNSLGTATEKAKFASERFGRNYTEIVKLLEAGGDAIRQMAKDTPEGLIIDDADIQRIKEYNRSLDEMGDAFSALKMEVGERLVPVMSDFMVGLMHQKELWAERNRLMGEGLGVLEANEQAMKNIKEALYGEAEGLNAVGDASGETADEVDALAEAQRAADEAAKSLTRALSGMLSSMFSINKENERYTETIANLTQKDAELAAEKNRLTLAMWEEQRAGKLTNDEYLDFVVRLDEITRAQQENADARTQAAEDLKKESEQRVYNMVQEQLAADGIITTGEYEYLQKLAVQKGLVSQEAANQALAERQAADQIVAAFGDTNNAMLETLSTMQQIASYNGTVVNFGVNFSQSGGMSSYNPQTLPGGYAYPHMDSGGQGLAGQPYMIGTGAQPELFVPDTNGTFVPNADKLGSTYNITIHNPKKEAAENSIRQALKSLSFLGVIDQ
jgi:hypothetical protein